MGLRLHVLYLYIYILVYLKKKSCLIQHISYWKTRLPLFGLNKHLKTINKGRPPKEIFPYQCLLHLSS